ncbi:DNA repair protein RecN [Shouchella lonarensis]|uniref:DNA repair protein RecN n=1 Tax=Shouchella lonarensis TaxID=1464122 RepID=A0A1G6IF80_9BACI|nr:DNA replication and repair protein RecN [Shouchella lonarensis]
MMLTELSIKNFAIIQQLTVPFEQGLTVLTGETGAGKSIIIDAVGLLLGARGSSDFIRHGEKRAEIEGLFHVDATHPVHEKLMIIGIDIEEDMLIIRRDITSAGKSICRINGKLTTISQLRDVGQSLIDVHGQHEHQTLMRKEEHLSLLDRFGGEELSTTLKMYQKEFRWMQQIEEQYRTLNQDTQAIAQKIDLYTYQSNEIAAAALTEHEDERLLEERYKLANSEKLISTLTASYEQLYGEGRGLDAVSKTLSSLEEAANIDLTLQPLVEQISTSYYTLEEAAFTLREAIDQVDFHSDRLNLVEARLAEIETLKRKYGESVSEILAHEVKIKEELMTLTDREDHVAALNEKRQACYEKLAPLAAQLTEIREKVAAKLSATVFTQLQQLYMEKATFKVKISIRKSEKALDHFGFNGKDQVEFLLSANRGEPLKSLAKVASGGEISRMMLALKSSLSASQGITSVIFDEVDSGVSGRVAQAIAEKVYRISMGSQVLCISHLPQVAAMADQHLFISKTEIDGRVVTNVKSLTEKEKIAELARMLSGTKVTEITRENAKELLQQAQLKKVVC